MSFLAQVNVKIPRVDFEKYGYSDKYPEFKRLMAFCDANRLRMAFYDEPGYLGIRVYGQDDEPITAFNNYTMYYDTMDKKMYFLGMDTWDAGMSILAKTIDGISLSSDEDIISSLGIGIG